MIAWGLALVGRVTPGGVTDNIGRVLAERMGRELGQSIIIDNVGGEVLAVHAEVGAAVLGKPLQATVTVTRRAPRQSARA